MELELEKPSDDVRNEKRAGRLVRLTAALSLFWERLWPLAVPAFVVVCLFLTVSWAGLWVLVTEQFGDLARMAGVGVFGIAIIASLYPLLKLHLPDAQSITRRIEQRSLLVDRPLTAQDDEIALEDGDGLGKALWAEHQKRMAARLSNMTGGSPRPDGSRFDPLTFRAIFPVIAFVAFLFSFSGGGGRVLDALEPTVDRADVLTRLDAWINPPTYTRKPPIYLSKSIGEENVATVSVPRDSEFYLRFVGDSEISLTFVEGETRLPIEPALDEEGNLEAGETEFKLPLTRNGVLELSSRGSEITRWPLAIIADTPPEIAFDEEPSAALSGSLQLTYSVKDDYGVVGAEAEIRSLIEVAPDARPLVEEPELPLPLPRQRAKEGSSKVNRDLTKHPWAGNDVEIKLIARDDAGQEGVSEIKTMELPGRNFSKPLSRALIEQRRVLAMDANQQHRVADLLDAVRSAPADVIDNPGAAMGMAIAYRRLRDARNDDDLRSTLDLLWEIALAVEFGDLSEAERRLREAQEALSEALEEGASDEEIERLMQELRQAMNEFMRQLAEQMRNNPDSQQAQNPFAQNELSQMLSQRDIERMMDQIEDLAKSGSRDAAREMLSEMQRMMDNLRAGQHQQQRQAEGNQMNQALDRLSELMQEQQRLMDESFRMQQRQNEMRNGEQQQGQQGQEGQRQQGQRGQQGQNGQRGQQGQRQQGQRGQNGQGEGQEQGQGQGGQMSPQELADALEQLRQQQEALRQQLQELGQELESLGLDPSEGFGRAEDEMGQAGENLGEGQPGSAMTDQGEALQALREGAQQMMQQMAGDQQQGGQQGDQRGQANARQRMNDPLGRSRDGNGRNFGDDVKVPGEIDAQEARRILDEIRKRLSNPRQPTIEKDYLERLLEDR